MLTDNFFTRAMIFVVIVYVAFLGALGYVGYLIVLALKKYVGA